MLLKFMVESKNMHLWSTSAEGGTPEKAYYIFCKTAIAQYLTPVSGLVYNRVNCL
jgi:hypothetical protein